jgi:hypothetical protein
MGRATTCVMSVEHGGRADVNPSVVRGRLHHAKVVVPRLLTVPLSTSQLCLPRFFNERHR